MQYTSVLNLCGILLKMCVVRFKNIKVHMESNNTRGKTNCINEINEKEPYGTKHSPNNVTNIYTD